MSGNSGIALARPLKLHDKPVTHVENFCATGSEALRGAAYAVASGGYDVAMAVGVEKVKDGGYQGLSGADVVVLTDIYAAGETPIPCVVCNQQIKFEELLATARDLEADALATGHYIELRQGIAGPELYRARDRDTGVR